jgi:hypothetical protein
VTRANNVKYLREESDRLEVLILGAGPGRALDDLLAEVEGADAETLRLEEETLFDRDRKARSEGA